jgi:hypothetical protein
MDKPQAGGRGFDSRSPFNQRNMSRSRSPMGKPPNGGRGFERNSSISRSPQKRRVLSPRKHSRSPMRK